MHPGPQIRAVHLQDPVHPDHLEDDAALEGDGPAAEVRTAAARHERNVVLVARPDDSGHLVGRMDEDHRVRAPLLQVGIVLVELEVDGRIQHVRLAHDPSKVIHERFGDHPLPSSLGESQGKNDGGTGGDSEEGNHESSLPAAWSREEHRP